MMRMVCAPHTLLAQEANELMKIASNLIASESALMCVHVFMEATATTTPQHTSCSWCCGRPGFVNPRSTERSTGYIRFSFYHLLLHIANEAAAAAPLQPRVDTLIPGGPPVSGFDVGHVGPRRARSHW